VTTDPAPSAAAGQHGLRGQLLGLTGGIDDDPATP